MLRKVMNVTYNYVTCVVFKIPTCFENPKRPTCVDLILKDLTRTLQNANVIETGLSHFH